ncbi:hypothetical protein DL546_003044 [Coniochaeta pulveracea]|uniref:Uncharacterized protein n=1 Tax=Coniochaeta pulveracea TaxID=177199 RepID=A0A420XZ08_9PEZI|nr:hypothetical protein DL546_003044 [Coniochaeta pulveracea]
MLRRSTLSDPVAETAAWQTELEEMNQTSYFPGFPTFDMSETRRRPASIRRAVVSRPRGRRNVESLQDAEEESEEEKQQPKVKPIDYQGLHHNYWLRAYLLPQLSMPGSDGEANLSVVSCGGAPRGVPYNVTDIEGTAEPAESEVSQ